MLRRIALLLVAVTLASAMVLISALSSAAQEGSSPFTPTGDDSSSPFTPTGDDSSGDPTEEDLLAFFDELASGGAPGEDTTPAPPGPGSEQEAPSCEPEWYQEWYPDWASGWWWFSWYQWCYDSNDGWYRSYDGWDWGPPMYWWE
jgi:hypothetical protein